MKIAISTLMHGRHETCRRALKMNRHAGIDSFMYAWTRWSDYYWCVVEKVETVGSIANIITLKAEASINAMEELPHDAVILMGSDDFIDTAYREAITMLLKDHDYIAPLNCYFEDGDDLYLWDGYPKLHRRHGEPCGAGKVLRRDLLEAMGYSVFSGTEGQTDYNAHRRIMEYAKNPIMIDIVEMGLMLCDIKDHDSTTPISRFKYLKRIK